MKLIKDRISQVKHIFDPASGGLSLCKDQSLATAILRGKIAYCDGVPTCNKCIKIEGMKGAKP